MIEIPEPTVEDEEIKLGEVYDDMLCLISKTNGKRAKAVAMLIMALVRRLAEKEDLLEAAMGRSRIYVTKN